MLDVDIINIKSTYSTVVFFIYLHPIWMWSFAMVSVWCDQTHYNNAAQICNLKKDGIKEKISHRVECFRWMPSAVKDSNDFLIQI